MVRASCRQRLLPCRARAPALAIVGLHCSQMSPPPLCTDGTDLCIEDNRAAPGVFDLALDRL
jgi:hypothetical protein